MMERKGESGIFVEREMAQILPKKKMSEEYTVIGKELGQVLKE